MFNKLRNSRRTKILPLCLSVILVFFTLDCLSQKTDTTVTPTPKKNNNIFQMMMNAITVGHSDSIESLRALSEAPFLPYYGKIIRHIIVNRFGFEKTFSDTATQINYAGTKLLNIFHQDSKEWVIRDNLFIKEGTPIDAYKIADNERFIRSLE
ncbi:MAG TPA: hypothetical protein VKR53_22020, partial [Puia sp.]|nr:hypothetical protein [Puia sp.]